MESKIDKLPDLGLELVWGASKFANFFVREANHKRLLNRMVGVPRLNK